MKASLGRNRIIGILIIVLAIFVFFERAGLSGITKNFPTAETGMSLGMLFLIGLITSVHCIAMCGGINLSQCLPGGAEAAKQAAIAARNARRNGKKAAAVVKQPYNKALLLPTILYNSGRIVSYTVVGTIVGALGSVFSFSGGMKGLVQIIAGVFMVVMGLNMFGVFPPLAKIVPKMPKFIGDKIENRKSSTKSPLIVGLLNGLMPCGPMQAMQLYALSTASPLKGGLSMFIFCLGTVPLMFGLGALGSALSGRFTRKVMTVGAALVVFLGLFMFTNGMNLSGTPVPGLAPGSSLGGNQPASTQIEIVDGIQVVRSAISSGRYPAITVAADMPVKWIIDAPPGSISGCNNVMQIPVYNIEYQFNEGENVLEFTPSEKGRFGYSCWMGMIRSSITVV